LHCATGGTTPALTVVDNESPKQHEVNNKTVLFMISDSFGRGITVAVLATQSGQLPTELENYHSYLPISL
jgi:hypothetical protein